MSIEARRSPVGKVLQRLIGGDIRDSLKAARNDQQADLQAFVDEMQILTKLNLEMA